MKKLLALFILLAFIFSCEQEKENKYSVKDLEYVTVIPGGCAIDETANLKGLRFDNDTVIFSSDNDTLNVFVGFNSTCCGEFNTSASINNDTIYLGIQTSVPGMCDCICYYTYTFRFKQFSKSYYYQVNIDDFYFFNGKINEN